MSKLWRQVAVEEATSGNRRRRNKAPAKRLRSMRRSALGPAFRRARAPVKTSTCFPPSSLSPSSSSPLIASLPPTCPTLPPTPSCSPSPSRLRPSCRSPAGSRSAPSRSRPTRRPSSAGRRRPPVLSPTTRYSARASRSSSTLVSFLPLLSPLPVGSALTQMSLAPARRCAVSRRRPPRRLLRVYRRRCRQRHRAGGRARSPASRLWRGAQRRRRGL